MYPKAAFFYDAHYVSLYNLSFKTNLETRAKLVSLYNAYLPHDLLVYPPIYFPTLIIVIFHFQFGAKNSQLTDHDIMARDNYFLVSIEAY